MLPDPPKAAEMDEAWITATGPEKGGSPPPPGQQFPRPWTPGVKTLPARNRRGSAVVHGHVHGTESGWSDAR